MQIFNNPNYNFVKYRWHAVAVSSLIILVGLVMFLTRGVNLGIDFAGGASIVLKFKEAVPLAQLRQQVQGATLQQYGRAEENSVQIRMPQQKREGDYAGAIVTKLHTDLNPEAATKLDMNYRGRDQIAALLMQADPDKRGSSPAAQDHYNGIARAIIEKRSDLGIFSNMGQVTSTPGVSAAAGAALSQNAILGDFNVLNQETVGPQVGGQLQRKALLAIILSSLAMGLYIWLRFDFVFGVASIICIIHDVLIALTFMLLLNLEFSLNVVAALLTIVGYSINDTVVMFDRIRENMRKIKVKGAGSMGDQLNQGINQTLSRTILTSGTVFLVLLAMLIFGGEVIRSFAWILTIGVISGTYSTLYIIPAVVIALDKWRNNRGPAAAAVRVEPARVEPAARKRRAS